ncbi:MAG: hypothetical protein L0221_06385, partial [Chloroflexi bacterium]|nr:hypothetical protein [Chloroflexota bacterium]
GKARRGVAAVVNTVSASAPLQALETCGVKASDIVTPLTIDPAPPFELTRPGTFGFSAKGGVSPYWASIRGPGDGVTVTSAAPASPAFSVTATKDAAPGGWVVTLIDSAGHVKQAQVNVKNGKPSGPSDTGPAAKPVSDESFNQLVKEIKGKSILIPGTGVTLKVGEPVRAGSKIDVPVDVESVAQYKDDAFTEGTVAKTLAGPSGINADRITIKDFKAVKEKAQDRAKPAAAPCDKLVKAANVKKDAEPVFSKQSEADRKKIQAALCTVTDGDWGSNSKLALQKYQCATNRPPDGKLTDALVSELKAFAPDVVKKRCGAP